MDANTFTTDNTTGPRDTIETLTEILQIFRFFITEEYEYTPTPTFVGFLETHLLWLASIDDDLRLYDFRNKYHLTELTNFLKEPNPYFKGCIKWWDELMDIAIGFRKFHDRLGTHVINTLPRDKYHDLDKQFAPIVSKLEYILERTPPADYQTMHENNRELYYNLNAVILSPERVDRFANLYGLESSAYLDAIDV